MKTKDLQLSIFMLKKKINIVFLLVLWFNRSHTRTNMFSMNVFHRIVTRPTIESISNNDTVLFSL